MWVLLSQFLHVQRFLIRLEKRLPVCPHRRVPVEAQVYVWGVVHGVSLWLQGPFWEETLLEVFLSLEWFSLPSRSANILST